MYRSFFIIINLTPCTCTCVRVLFFNLVRQNWSSAKLFWKKNSHCRQTVRRKLIHSNKTDQGIFDRNMDI